MAFFILLTAVYLILRAWIVFDPLSEASVKNDMENLAVTSPRVTEVLRLFSANINNLLFLLVFSIAFSLKLFFRKRYNLAEYTSIALFIAGIYTLIRILLMFIGRFGAIDISDIEFWFLFILIFYSSFSLFQQKHFWPVVKYTLVSLTSLALYVIFALGFFFLIVSLK